MECVIFLWLFSRCFSFIFGFQQFDSAVCSPGFLFIYSARWSLSFRGPSNCVFTKFVEFSATVFSNVFYTPSYLTSHSETLVTCVLESLLLSSSDCLYCFLIFFLSSLQIRYFLLTWFFCWHQTALSPFMNFFNFRCIFKFSNLHLILFRRFLSWGPHLFTIC